MNLIRALLCQTLNTQNSELQGVVSKRLIDSPFSASVSEDIDAFLAADPALVDSLWKFSVGLGVPHQWLFDVYRVQQNLTAFPCEASGPVS